ncbi:hypothetical protein SAMN06893096_10233 [Geodermatophilus pulveris]|uniref:N-acetyltransferase domain-containing protein n=1 Tax=Geodermatophilus pulveris TaxID=1564159 RepID=A0A239BT12_9ACTN|nr:hypothetical protein SAMN06893096_10233 [Geodermatophilus pulveris]
MNGAATGVTGSLVYAARRDAEEAARTAGVDIRTAARGGVQEIVSTVWGPGQRLQANLLMAMAHAGGTVAAAVRGDGPVGACVGFLGWNGGVHLHSHMAAVRPGARTTGVGCALKLWQRAVCLEHGIAEIRWTFDSLVRRNAYFNLAKLGARVIDYRPDRYGEMDEIVNAGDRSDRFEVCTSPRAGFASDQGHPDDVQHELRAQVVGVCPDRDAVPVWSARSWPNSTTNGPKAAATSASTSSPAAASSGCQPILGTHCPVCPYL